jgi:hypothetical protein
LYLRPLLFGTLANIGAASIPASGVPDRARGPVWDYFSGGVKPLRIYVEDQSNRTAAHLGTVKTGGNTQRRWPDSSPRGVQRRPCCPARAARCRRRRCDRSAKATS